MAGEKPKLEQPAFSSQAFPSTEELWAGSHALPLSLQPALRSGDLCPRCGVGRLKYDGLLNLACPHCDFAESGGAGCT